ncbi:MAG: gfo/Idh/MocA family oxidoreductase [Paenibacillaceae bacterium]|nr:gfo/Idh/MocA family oxidoreductase [Paenibacillaceae bacterium]
MIRTGLLSQEETFLEKIKVGMIGLGSVAQIIHLPIMEALSDRYELGAICDISGQLLEAIGTRYNVAHRYTDAFEMVSQANLDAVFVLSNDEYHAEYAIAALTQGKHVLIEKPVCLTMEEANSIIKARDAAGVQAMVGYMRRFAPAFTEAVEEVRQLGRINYVRVRSLIGAGRLFIDETSHVLRPLDIPPEAVLDRRQRTLRMLEKATDNAPRVKQNAYRAKRLSAYARFELSRLVGYEGNHRFPETSGIRRSVERREIRKRTF